jgi:hypothetical protein
MADLLHTPALACLARGGHVQFRAPSGNESRRLCNVAIRCPSALHLHRGTGLVFAHGRDDQMPTRTTSGAFHELTQWTEGIDDGLAGRIGHELRQRLQAA